MSSQFYSELSRADGQVRAELRRRRDRFLAYRERCPDEGCVEQAYLDRMDEIADIVSGSSLLPSSLAKGDRAAIVQSAAE
jgi:uncharacterized protein